MGLEGRQLFRRFGYRRLGLMLKRQDIKLPLEALSALQGGAADRTQAR
jgi:hypothetical protein